MVVADAGCGSRREDRRKGELFEYLVDLFVPFNARAVFLEEVIPGILPRELIVFLVFFHLGEVGLLVGRGMIY